LTLLRDLVRTHIHCRRSPGFGLLGEMNSEILGFMILDPEGCWAVMRSRGLRLSTCFMLGVMRFSFDGLSLSAQRQAFSPQNTSVQLATARDRSMQRSSSADRLDFPTVFHLISQSLGGRLLRSCVQLTKRPLVLVSMANHEVFGGCLAFSNVYE